MDTGDDRRYPQRLVLALAGAVALHTILALVWPAGGSRDVPESATRAEIVTIALRTPRPTPPPSPVPTPTPPPATPAPHYSLAPRIVVRAPAPKAAATPRHAAGGAAAPKHLARVRSARPQPAAPDSVVAGTNAGQADGGTGTGAGAGNGDGGLAGTGTGTGGTGTGNGGGTNAAPCGDVFLLPGALAYRKDGTVVQQVLAKIVERDGTVQVDRFPYPFVYPREKANPFRHDEAVNADGGIPVQEPPPGADVDTMPASVRIVLKYTDPKTGVTSLPACSPQATPPRNE